MRVAVCVAVLVCVGVCVRVLVCVIDLVTVGVLCGCLSLSVFLF